MAAHSGPIRPHHPLFAHSWRRGWKPAFLAGRRLRGTDARSQRGTHHSTSRHVLSESRRAIHAGCRHPRWRPADRGSIHHRSTCRVVVAVVNGEFTVKRLQRTGKELMLIAEHPEYPPIVLGPEIDAWTWVSSPMWFINREPSCTHWPTATTSTRPVNASSNPGSKANPSSCSPTTMDASWPGRRKPRISASPWANRCSSVVRSSRDTMSW